MQLASSRIWTHVAVSISYDDSHYTTTYIMPGHVTYYLPITGGRIIHTFPKAINTRWNANSALQDLNSYRQVHFQRR